MGAQLFTIHESYFILCGAFRYLVLTRGHAETREDPIRGNLNLRILVRMLVPALNHKSVPSHGEIGSVFVQTAALDELLSVSDPHTHQIRVPMIINIVYANS